MSIYASSNSNNVIELITEMQRTVSGRGYIIGA